MTKKKSILSKNLMNKRNEYIFQNTMTNSIVLDSLIDLLVEDDMIKKSKLKEKINKTIEEKSKMIKHRNEIKRKPAYIG